MVGEDYKCCSRCSEEKHLSEFYKRKTAKDGRYSQCKVCHNAKSKAWAKANPERRRKIVSNWKKRHRKEVAAESKRWAEANPQKRIEIERQSRKRNRGSVKAKERRKQERHPEKYQARRVLRQAVKRGHIRKPAACEGCDSETEARRLHGHHEDYSRPLDVEWLCEDCHAERHGKRPRPKT